MEEYPVFEETDLDGIKLEYPVVVKPADGSGSRGVSICRDRGEVVTALEKAKEQSRTGHSIVKNSSLRPSSS